MSVTELETPAANGIPPADDPGEQGWRQDGQGRWCVSGAGIVQGNIYRRGNETPAEARERAKRDAGKDKPPRRKSTGSPKPPKPPAPTQTNLKELEHLLAEGLKSPALICAAMGDEWPAEHLTKQGPVLARNLVHAAQYNPWLRAKLEAAVMGEDLMVKIVTAAGLAGSAFLYLIPVVAYYTGAGPAAAREMLGVPDRAEDQERKRREQEERDAQAAEAAAAAAPEPAEAAAA